MMNLSTKITLLVVGLLAVGSSAFAHSSTPPFFSTSPRATTTHNTLVAPLNAYTPDGLTAKQYQQIKRKEQLKTQGKNLGRLGPRGFKSRSMEAWQKAYEHGNAKHSFAPVGFQAKLKQGLLRREDVPYMVRGGSWDNSDVLGARRLKWTKEDKVYASGGYKKEQSASLLGTGPGIDWTSSRPRSENLKRIVPGFLN